MILQKIIFAFLTGCIGICLTPAAGFCQQLPVTTPLTPQDTVRTVEILPGVKKLEYRKIDSVTEVQILSGNVKLRQGTSLFECDSCVINKRLNLFEAFGNVHINDSDTANVYANHLRYLTDKRIAYLDGRVKLTDGNGILTTPYLEYDVNTKVGIYKKGGKVVNKSTVLTSDEGYYYADLKDVYFRKKVKLIDPKYELETDSLLYNTESETARLIAETFIKDSSNRTIRTREGFYNLQTGKAEFGQRPVVQDGAIQATGEKIYSDDSSGTTQIIGQAILVDTAAGRTVLAGEIFFNNKSETFLATKKPLMIIRQENDSIFITADTLFSARLTDLYTPIDTATQTDTLAPRQVNDSIMTGLKKPLFADSLMRPGFAKPDLNKLNTGRMNPMIDSSQRSVVQQNTDTTLRIDTTLQSASSGIKKTDSAATNAALQKQIPLAPDSNLLKKSAPKKPASEKLTPPTRNKNSFAKTDTLKSGKPTNLNTNDSTNRYFEAYRNVRIYTDSLQAICDSLFYSFRDSVFRLYDHPVVWSKESQITGDTILLHTKNKKAHRMEVFKNSFLASLVKPDLFNQVKAIRLDAYFVDGSLDSVRAKGQVESIYYIQDEDSAFTGINESSCEMMDIYFRDKELHRVVFRSKVKGTLWPMQQKTPQEMRLEKFQWLESKRPKTRYELFE